MTMYMRGQSVEAIFNVYTSRTTPLRASFSLSFKRSPRLSRPPPLSHLLCSHTMFFGGYYNRSKIAAVILPLLKHLHDKSSELDINRDECLGRLGDDCHRHREI
ncbi:hypothetical protein LguiB_007994 [Lonicera macranthoides]